MDCLALSRSRKKTLTFACLLAGGVLLASALPLRNAFAQNITGFEGFTVGSNGTVMFRQPRFSGTSSGFLNTTPDQAVISTERANTGTQSLKVSFQFLANQTNPFVRLTTSGAANFPNPALDFGLALQLSIYVPASTPNFYLTLGVRETGTTAAVGANGGTTGTIEYVGATSRQGSAPIGKLITTKDSWLTVVFNIPTEPLQPFTGNGVLDTARGVLENLTITPTSSGDLGPYIFYLDDFKQMTALVAPEPGSLALLAAGVLPLAGAVAVRRRYRRKA